MSEEEVLRQIDRYFKGELTSEQADHLWAILLEHPEYYGLFEAESAARRHFSRHPSRGASGGRDAPECYATPSSAGEPSGSVAETSPVEATPEMNDAVVKVSEADQARHQVLTGQGRRIAGIVVLFLVIFALRFVSSQMDRSIPGLWEVIPVDEMVTTDLLRDGEAGFSPVDVEINMGFRQAAEGEFNESIEIFSSVMSGETNDLQFAASSINHGILLFNAGEYHQAEESFKRVIDKSGDVDSDHLSGKANWYLAQSLMHQQRHREALPIVRQAIELGGIHEEDARELLDWLINESGNNNP